MPGRSPSWLIVDGLGGLTCGVGRRVVGLCLVVRRLGLVVRGLGPLALGCRVGEDLRGFGGFGLCGLLGLFGGGLRVGGAGLRLVGLVERGLGSSTFFNAASYVDWALRTPLT